MILKPKAVVGFALYPERGGYYPTFKLAKALEKSGYKVIYFGTSEFKKDVDAQGLEFQSLFQDRLGESAFDPAPLPEGASILKRLKHMLSERRRILTVLFDALTSGELIHMFRSRDVDLLLVDALLSPVAIAAHSAKIPIISIATELVGADTALAPHFSSLICDSNSPFLSQRIALRWLIAKYRAWISTKLLSIIDFALHFPYIDRQFIKLEQSYELIRAQSGLTFTDSEYGPRPVFHEVVLCPSEFEYKIAPAVKRRKYIGHCIDLHRKEVEFSWSNFDQKKPIVYCSLGTHAAHYPKADLFFREILKTARKNPQFNFVVSMGAGRQIEAYGDVPVNLIARVRLPQLAILKQAAMMITNGGLGTVKECIYFAVPMLIIPCDFDQPGNAARACFHKLARRADMNKISEKLLTSHIFELINNPIYKENILKMSESVRTDQEFSAGLSYIKNTIDAHYIKPKKVQNSLPVTET